MPVPVLRTKPISYNAISSCAQPTPSSLIKSELSSSSGTQRPISPLRLSHAQYSFCLSILHGLQRHFDAGPFLFPPDPQGWGLPNYDSIVKHPMDLSTVEKKLNQDMYATPIEFIYDLRLIFDNMRAYYAPNTNTRKMGERLEQYLEWQLHREKAKAIFADNLENGKSIYPHPTLNNKPSPEEYSKSSLQSKDTYSKAHDSSVENRQFDTQQSHDKTVKQETMSPGAPSDGGKFIKYFYLIYLFIIIFFGFGFVGDIQFNSEFDGSTY